MSDHLVLTVRVHDARYHGADEWPPSPARLFQALVAGAARGSVVPVEAHAALEWLERRPAPLIAAPVMAVGQTFDSFVPNNDADALGGDLSKLPNIRTKKTVRPRLLSDPAFIYAWQVEANDAAGAALARVSEELYQLGRGVDMAWAAAELISGEELESRLDRHRGTVHRPGAGAAGQLLACPTRGSFQSLVERYSATLHRLRDQGIGREATTLFSQPPKPHFTQVRYDADPQRLLYEFRYVGDGDLQPWPVWKIVALVERLRDAAVATLRAALPDQADSIEGALLGRKKDGADAICAERRIRIVPLPSAGHAHADRAVRRVLVEVPGASPISAADANWAFSALESCDPATGVVDPWVVTPGADRRMLDFFTSASREWSTVTPAALPESAKRRRIEPTRMAEERKGAPERMAEEARARGGVVRALRHVGVRAKPLSIEVQREPFDAKGTKAERFAAGPRFPKERLWHVRLRFAEVVTGPLVLGDGRFLGLGIFAPRRESSSAYSLTIEGGLEPGAKPADVAAALRRAVMSRVQSTLVRGPLPSFFSGHAANGAAANAHDDPHIAYQVELPNRLLVLAPEHLRVGHPRTPPSLANLLDRAIGGLTELRSGGAGLLTLRVAPIDPVEDHLFAHSREWRSVHAYAVNRHRKVGSPAKALELDAIEDCLRAGMPRPVVTVESVCRVDGKRLGGMLRLSFAAAVAGPIILGRTRYLGGGLFTPVVKSPGQ